MSGRPRSPARVSPQGDERAEAEAEQARAARAVQERRRAGEGLWAPGGGRAAWGAIARLYPAPYAARSVCSGTALPRAEGELTSCADSPQMRIFTTQGYHADADLRACEEVPASSYRQRRTTHLRLPRRRDRRHA